MFWFCNKLGIPQTASDEKQLKIKFNRKNARDKLNSILYGDQLEMSEKRSHKEFDRVGEVSFKDFDFNYFADGPLVLRSMNFKIQSGEKIGIGKLFGLLFCYNLYLLIILLINFSELGKLDELEQERAV